LGTERGRIDIADLGDVRRVELFGDLYSFHRRRAAHLVFETTYSEALLRLIARNKGIDYLKDEIDRDFEPGYLFEPMRRLITRYVDVTRIGACHVLDYGCGSAASTVNLARILPQARIAGIDIAPGLVEIGRARVREFGLQDRIELHVVEPNTPLPFEPARFDLVMADGVFEHIDPRARSSCFGEVWRVMRPGGHLFVRETPNRFFPYDGHTSRLPFVHWLPLWLAGPLVRALSPRGLSDRSNSTLVEVGLIGLTYYEVLRHIRAAGGQPEDLTRTNRHCVEDFFLFWIRKEPRVSRRAIKLVVHAAFHVLELIVRPLGVPIAALLPSLDLCVRKVR
jgi:ubiquinone/menaquinone biosynthesis C-methylase UbiE